MELPEAMTDRQHEEVLVRGDVCVGLLALGLQLVRQLLRLLDLGRNHEGNVLDFVLHVILHSRDALAVRSEKAHRHTVVDLALAAVRVRLVVVLGAGGSFGLKNGHSSKNTPAVRTMQVNRTYHRDSCACR